MNLPEEGPGLGIGPAPHFQEPEPEQDRYRPIIVALVVGLFALLAAGVVAGLLFQRGRINNGSRSDEAAEHVRADARDQQNVGERLEQTRDSADLAGRELIQLSRMNGQQARRSPDGSEDPDTALMNYARKKAAPAPRFSRRRLLVRRARPAL